MALLKPDQANETCMDVGDEASHAGITVRIQQHARAGGVEGERARDAREARLLNSKEVHRPGRALCKQPARTSFIAASEQPAMMGSNESQT
jgi:hypothetical protein